MSLLLRGTLMLDKRENLEIEGEYAAVFGTAIADSSEFSIRAGESIAIVHTELEDRTLQRELPGYPYYVRRARTKLIPGLW